MRLALIGLFFFFISTPLIARDLPKNVCYQNRCSEAQLKIWEDFQNGTGFNKEEMNGLYSGACYHLSSRYDNKHPHYAVVLIQSKNNESFFAGRFSFFANPNPYANWNEEDARAQFPQIFQEKKKLKHYENYAFIDLNPNEVPLLLYWIRKDVATNDVLMIAMWGTDQTIFCRLPQNQ